MSDASLSLIPGASFGDIPIKARPLDLGMGVAVGRRTVFRPSDEEDFGKVADRVAAGNMALARGLGCYSEVEEQRLRNAIACGALLTSGRHLQHGDLEQPDRNLEIYSNCATSISSFAKFLLLLCGSGVGRSYDDELMVVDWAAAPDILLYLSPEHPDSRPEFMASEFGVSLNDLPAFKDRELLVNIANAPAGSIIYRVEDSREGWAKGLEVFEALTYKKDNRYPLILDCSDIRPCGAPIHGMQDRPASGPLSLMRAYINARRDVIQKARRVSMPLWEQAMRFDHAFSIEVQVGGARRAARMATKSWKDPDILDFIRIKSQHGLWTSNNSIMVDKEFWDDVRAGEPRAKEIFDEATRCMYSNGEPGFINGDQLEDNVTGSARERPIDYDGSSFRSKRYKVDAAVPMMTDLTTRAQTCRYPTIVNPCAEVSPHVTGSYCVIADFAAFLAQLIGASDEIWDYRVEDAIRLIARFLVRTNTMDAFYGQETRRTNRIGISPTGIHEWAWVRFDLSFEDMLDEYGKAAEFWATVKRMSDAGKDEANRYSESLGLSRPVAITTIKPSGSVSKLFGITEGAHLPARKRYLRWVQFRGVRDPVTCQWVVGSDPLLADYDGKGYPLRELKTFPGMTVVGFPTEPLIMRLGMKDKIVTASEATPAQQYTYLRLLEKYWIGERQGGQVSYTLKMYTDRHSLEDFREIVLKEQPTIRCCAILPTLPEHLLPYEYMPEEEISDAEYEALVAKIEGIGMDEDIDMETLKCASGVCPI